MAQGVAVKRRVNEAEREPRDFPLDLRIAMSLAIRSVLSLVHR
uniref:Uncharacterized protein n=1 Tax=Peronospora matthiolae TaxID=2874970 RepID=A0AAV1UGL8_9STRA